MWLLVLLRWKESVAKLNWSDLIQPHSAGPKNVDAELRFLFSSCYHFTFCSHWWSCQAEQPEWMKKRNWRFRSEFQNIRSWSCAVENLMFVLYYQVTDVVTKRIRVIQFTVFSKKPFKVRMFTNPEFQWVHVEFSFVRLIECSCVNFILREPPPPPIYFLYLYSRSDWYDSRLNQMYFLGLFNFLSLK